MNNFQRAIDDHVTGRYHPDNPANQEDIWEKYSQVLEVCEFITEDTIEDDEQSTKLEGIFEDVIEPYFSHKHFTSQERSEFMRLHADDMAAKIKKLWEER